MLYDIEVEGFGEVADGDTDTDRYFHFTVEAHAPRRERNGAQTIPTALIRYALHRAQADGVRSGVLRISGYQPVRILANGDWTGSATYVLDELHWNTWEHLRSMIDRWSQKPQNGRTVFYRPTERY